MTPPTPPLTTTEREILQAMAEGQTTSAVAERLSLTTLAVHGHVREILHKFGVDTKVEAVMVGLRLGVVDARGGGPTA